MATAGSEKVVTKGRLPRTMLPSDRGYANLDADQRVPGSKIGLTKPGVPSVGPNWTSSPVMKPTVENVDGRESG